ncbi:hypothetical protein GBAR_LOCUS8664 [Geodia barretti]|nr:hypothetical protein GBAR_LOCUS8664 [Geodia barretti]
MEEQDCQMRSLIYLMLSRDGGQESQKALVAALDMAINEDEERAIVVYIAFTESPQPGMVSELEERIGDNVHSTEPLLLAYGALVARASPALQQRMTLFLLNRLPVAKANTTSLMHHIFSLGNTESQLSTDSLVNYLSHPDELIQFSAIHALRYATGECLVQKAFKLVVSQSNVSEDHVFAVLHCLLSGIEHASSKHTQPPFNLELAVSLVSSVMASENGELQQLLASYLQLVGNEDSRHLLTLMTAPLSKEGYSNSTRMKRGSNWAESNSVYDLIASLNTRQTDKKTYPLHKAYIWGKKFGTSKANLQVAAGGFIGAANGGQYKVFGRAKAVGEIFQRKKTLLDFLVLREKGTTSTRTRLFAQIAGKTLANIDIRSPSTVCKRYSKEYFAYNKYLVFDFSYPIKILVATIKVGITGYVRLGSNMYVEFCEKVGSLTAEAGLESTISLEIQGGFTGSLLNVARGGVTVNAVLNYKLIPALSTELCLTSSIRVKNCIGIYHQWANNKILLDVWYQRKKCKSRFGVFPLCRTVWAEKQKVEALSASWNLPSTAKTPLWRKCDSSFVCRSSTAVASAVSGPPGMKAGSSRLLRLNGPAPIPN